MTPAQIESLREEAQVGLPYPEIEHRFALFIHYADHYGRLARSERDADAKRRLYDKAEEATENALAMIGAGRRNAR